MSDIDEAKAIFKKYNGEHYYMTRDTVDMFAKYKQYGIDKEMENIWREEMLAEYQDKILLEPRTKNAVYIFWTISELNNRVKSQEYLSFLVDYLRDNFYSFDSFCKILLIENLSRKIHVFPIKVQYQTLKYLRHLCAFITSNPIELADDSHKYHMLPEFFTKEVLEKRANNDLIVINKAISDLEKSHSSNLDELGKFRGHITN